MKRLPLLIVLVLLLAGAGTAAFSYSVRLSYFRAERQNNDFLLTWQAEQEEDVRAYELFRKTSYSADFLNVQNLPAHGVGKEYRFRDDQVYKASSEQVDYRLDAVLENGERVFGLAEKKVNYTPTAVRRTWGSIKAMFQ